MKSIFLYVLTLLFSCMTFSVYAQSGLAIDSGELAKKNLALDQLKRDRDEMTKQVEELEKAIKEMTTPSSYWKWSMFTTATANQSQYVNWVAGGESAVAFILTNKIALEYVNTPSKINWSNQFNGFLGYRTANSEWQKVNDILSLNSNFGYQLFPKLSIASDLSLRTQFLNTPDYSKTDRPVLSSFFAPAYLNIGLGVKWVPLPWIKAYLSPMTSQVTLVLDDLVDPVNFGVKSGSKGRGELGWYANIDVSKSIVNNVTVGAVCILFNNYLSDQPNNAIDVDLRFKLDAKVSKNFYTFFFLNLKYDADAKIKVATTDATSATYRDAGLQVFENMGVGFSYTVDKFL